MVGRGTAFDCLGVGGEGGGDTSRRTASVIRRVALTFEARCTLPFAGMGGGTATGGVELVEDGAAAFLGGRPSLGAVDGRDGWD